MKTVIMLYIILLTSFFFFQLLFINMLKGQSTSSLRKGRNVDKACNHCKRSHLRCDNMRPCRRCVATGKTGCKDVEHKPRGRPRLNKNQHNVKTRGI